ncbi:MAG: hypothetical protein KDK62_03390 [Chlamydiia bacterium]|nr:hypothetical protein [Chlamydiia bacterium]
MALDRLENEPVSFSEFRSDRYQDWIEASNVLYQLYENPKLLFRTLSLKYRIEEENGGMSASITSGSDLEALIARAREYKKNQEILWRADLTEQDEGYLIRASRYPAYTEALMRDESSLKAFFDWIIRDGIPPEPYLEFPANSEVLMEHLLTGRIGTLGGDKLKVQKISVRGEVKKILSLPFEGKELSLLDKSQKVTFRGDYTLSIEEIFRLFQDKPKQFVNVEYFAQGVMNWNAQHLGYWIPKENRYSVINLEQIEWWRQLPPLEILDIEEAKNKYGSWINGMNWAVSAKAARQYCNLNIGKCHAYLEIAVPFKDGSYYVYDFGKFARHFPYGVVDNMKMFTYTTPATVAYPDENIYHTARQQVGYSFEMNHYQGLILMETIRKDIEGARAGNMVFQIEAENCAHWIQTHLEEILGKSKVPNLFRAKLNKSEAGGLVGGFLRMSRSAPKFLQVPILLSIHYPFGPWRGQYVTDRTGEKVFKSLNRTSFWKDIIVYTPAFLHYQFEKGILKPNLSYDELDEVIEKPDSSIELVEKSSKG